MNNKPHFYRVPLSFVRRGGRITASQAMAWEKYASKYLVDVDRDILDTSIAAGFQMSPETIFGNEQPLVVEIGTGMGDAIVYAAQNNPDTNFLGVEVYRAGLAKTMLEAAKLNLQNIKVVEANAPEVLNKLLPPNSLSELRIFFPDPWHKSKHHKRRLISETFTDLAHRSLKPAGLVRMATDWEEYAEQMRAVFDENNNFKREFDSPWAERFSGRPITAFEQKGINKGREIRDLTYSKQG